MTAALNLAREHAECSSCKSSIVWAVSAATGNKMPVDYNPDEQRGNVQLSEQDGQLVATVLNERQAAGARAARQELRTSHSGTCPHTDGRRRR